MARSVYGGQGITAMKYSGKTQERVPSDSQSSSVTRSGNKTRGPGYSLAGGQGVLGINFGGRLAQAATAMRAAGQKMTTAAKKAPGPTVVPTSQVISNVTRERTSPVPSRPAAPARMGVTPATGKTTGFTSGTKTGATTTKAGKAFKTAESAYQRQQRMALEKMGVVGPRGGASKTSSSAGGMRSTGGGSRSSGGGAVGSTSGTRGYSSGGNTGRGDVGAGRRGGGR
jgi:hypothetical protein